MEVKREIRDKQIPETPILEGATYDQTSFIFLVPVTGTVGHIYSHCILSSLS